MPQPTILAYVLDLGKFSCMIGYYYSLLLSRGARGTGRRGGLFLLGKLGPP